jgi:hypothetical protein
MSWKRIGRNCSPMMWRPEAGSMWWMSATRPAIDRRACAMNQTISYQGEPGANSHIIINEAYPDWTPPRSWGVSTPSGTSSTTTASIRIPASSARSCSRPE